MNPLFYLYFPSFVVVKLRLLFFIKHYFEYTVFVCSSNRFNVCYLGYFNNLIFSLRMIAQYLKYCYVIQFSPRWSIYVRSTVWNVILPTRTYCNVLDMVNYLHP